MNVLAIDTALEACSVAVSIGSSPTIVSRTEPVVRGHAERLFGLIEGVLGEAELAIGDIDRFGVTVGPGSFTGIRVGVAAVRGFALVTGAPAVGVSTLAAFAEAARATAGAQPVLAVLPAKGGEAFAQLFDPLGEEAAEPKVARPADLAALAAKAGASLAGPAADQIVDAAPNAGLVVIHRHATPDIAAVVALAARASVGDAPKPLYVKLPDAIASQSPVPRR